MGRQLPDDGCRLYYQDYPLSYVIFNVCLYTDIGLKFDSLPAAASITPEQGNFNGIVCICEQGYCIKQRKSISALHLSRQILNSKYFLTDRGRQMHSTIWLILVPLKRCSVLSSDLFAHRMVCFRCIYYPLKTLLTILTFYVRQNNQNNIQMFQLFIMATNCFIFNEFNAFSAPFIIKSC